MLPRHTWLGDGAGPRVRRTRPVRPPRLVAACGAGFGPVWGLAHRFAVDRVPWPAPRTGCAFPAPRLDGQTPRGGPRKAERFARLDLLGPPRTRLDSFRSRSRPLFCASRVLPRLNAVAVLTAITWNHDEPPISHNYHRNSQLFSSEIYETGRMRRVSYISDKVSQT